MDYFICMGNEGSVRNETVCLCIGTGMTNHPICNKDSSLERSTKEGLGIEAFECVYAIGITNHAICNRNTSLEKMNLLEFVMECLVMGKIVVVIRADNRDRIRCK